MRYNRRKQANPRALEELDVLEGTEAVRTGERGYNVEPEFYAIILALVAANSGLWRVIDNYILGRSKCGSMACNKAVVSELEKNVTIKKNGREPA